MSKLVVGIVGAAIVAGGATFGGMQYADKQLKQRLYLQDNPQASKQFQVKLDHYQMGLTEGSAKWTGELIPDLCEPNIKLSVRGEDTIKRGLSGVQIQSKVYFKPDNGAEIFLFNGDSQVSWSGDGNTKILIDAGSHEENGTTISWEAVNAELSYSKLNGSSFDKMDFSLPRVKVNMQNSDNGKSFDFEWLNTKSHNETGLGSSEKLKNGKDFITIESIKLNMPEDNFQLSLNQLDSRAEQIITGDKFNLNSTARLGSFEVNGQKLENIQYNLNFADLNLSAVNQFNQFIIRSSRECVPQHEIGQSLKKAAFDLLNSGFKIDSKGNVMEFNGHKATADADLSLPAGDYGNEQTAVQKLQEAVSYHVDVSVDKAFISDIMKAMAQAKGEELTDEKIEEAIQEGIAKSGATLEGDVIKFNISK